MQNHTSADSTTKRREVAPTKKPDPIATANSYLSYINSRMNRWTNASPACPLATTATTTAPDDASPSPARSAQSGAQQTTEPEEATSIPIPPSAPSPCDRAGSEPVKQEQEEPTINESPRPPASTGASDIALTRPSKSPAQNAPAPAPASPAQGGSASAPAPTAAPSPRHASNTAGQPKQKEKEIPTPTTDDMHTSPVELHDATSFSNVPSGMPAPYAIARKSMDSAATARTLPSPAPSDENNSPTFGHGTIPGRRRPVTIRPPTQGSAPTTILRTQPSAAAIQQNQTPQNGSTAPIQQQWATATSQPPQRSALPRPANIHILPSSPSTQPPHSLSLARIGQPQATMVYTASRLPVPTLLAQLDAQRERLSRDGSLQGTDSGRLTLLRDAVVRHDWFYQMLSQVFCLHSMLPDMLPHVLHQVPPQSYSIISALLCANDKVNPSLLKFFSAFPEPIMTIYSDTSNAREVYETRLRSIAVFLQKLPVHWDNLVAQCKTMLAPPLVQDLVGILNMQSEVLQTTAFRAITRMFWGIEDNAGMKVIEEVHMIDQQNYYRHGFRRNQQEKNHAYRMLTFVYQKWQIYRQMYGPGDHFNNFSMPFQVRECFGKFPRSCAPAGSQSPAQAHPPHAQETQQPDRNRQVAHQAPGEAQHPAHRSPSLQSQSQPHSQPQFRTQTTPQPQPQVQPRRQQPALQDQRGQPVTSDMARIAQFNHLARSGIDSASLPMPSPGTMAAPRGSVTSGGNPIKRLYPLANSGQRPQPTHPNSNISALHQAHLRSPKLIPRGASKAGNSDLYRHVVGYGLTPTTVLNSTPIQTMTFAMSPSTMARVAKSTKSALPGEPPIRTVDESSLMYRLRCCAIPPNGFTDEGSWIVSDNFWPDGMTFSLNDTQLETRRKLHHGRYLPIDVTDVVREDKNELRISINRKDGAVIKARYAVAIEAVGVISHKEIKTSLKHIAADDSLKAIKKSLTGADDSDDDIAVTSSVTVIQVTDPYTQTSLAVAPVRGSACLHRDCFDLDVFLSQRPRAEPGAPTVVDCWKCPICLGDVRPQLLVLDEFLVEVRNELVKRGLKETKAIQVQADGTWKPKQEEKTGVKSASLERELQQQTKKKSVPPVEIIELD
ncbi:hypothetical protein TI39_contig468g00034 [Zymoseptoria brevis]|uniref:SP-RING-type domain-containing protein n=1 Tax=Zymoseptoria brevis TaxID=1047168 RepID=A0A0F4GKF6_9PEZI|nr:hypothetical protein TI39_contig468g00034 [Zymoseptoria brevis]